jgi:hypothetical protein
MSNIRHYVSWMHRYETHKRAAVGFFVSSLVFVTVEATTVSKMEENVQF